MPEEGPFGPAIIVLFRLSRFAKSVPAASLQSFWMDCQSFCACQLVQVPIRRLVPSRQNAFKKYLGFWATVGVFRCLYSSLLSSVPPGYTNELVPTLKPFWWIHFKCFLVSFIVWQMLLPNIHRELADSHTPYVCVQIKGVRQLKKSRGKKNYISKLHILTQTFSCK